MVCSYSRSDIHALHAGGGQARAPRDQFEYERRERTGTTRKRRRIESLLAYYTTKLCIGFIVSKHGVNLTWQYRTVDRNSGLELSLAAPL